MMLHIITIIKSVAKHQYTQVGIKVAVRANFSLKTDYTALTLAQQRQQITHENERF